MFFFFSLSQFIKWKASSRYLGDYLTRKILKFVSVTSSSSDHEYPYYIVGINKCYKGTYNLNAAAAHTHIQRKITSLCGYVKKKLIVKLKRKKDINVISPLHLLCTYTSFLSYAPALELCLEL